MKALFAVLALIVSFHQASATSILGEVLEYQNLSKLAGGVSHTLSVYVDGQVVHRTTQAVPGGLRSQKLLNLTPMQMRKINRLVRLATPARMGREVSQARCFAPSNQTSIYTATNNTLQLRRGAVCDGGFDVNLKPAAKTLVRVLDTLEAGYHQRTNLAQLEAQLDAILR